MWFGRVRQLREFIANLKTAEIVSGEVRELSAACEARRKGSSGRPPKFSTEPFTKHELAGLKLEILEVLCDEYPAQCSECSLEGGPNDPEIAEIVWQLPKALQQCPMRLQLSQEYRQWVGDCLDVLNAIPKGAGCEALRRIKSKEVPLSWAFVMVYMQLVFVLCNAKDNEETVTTPGGKETTREEGQSRFFNAHAYTRDQWKSAIDKFEVYKNCCANDEKYLSVRPEHLGEIHKIKRRLLSLAEAALACCGDLDNWIAKSYSSENSRILGEFLAARILPAFIYHGPKYSMEKWWAEASVIMSAGMRALPPVLQPDKDPPDFDPDYLRNLGRKDCAEGEHMLFYLSIPHPEDGHLAELCLDYLRGIPQYQGKMIEKKDERE